MSDDHSDDDRELVIEFRDPRELTAHPQNYRKHPSEQLGRVKRRSQP